MNALFRVSGTGNHLITIGKEEILWFQRSAPGWTLNYPELGRGQRTNPIPIPLFLRLSIISALSNHTRSASSLHPTSPNLVKPIEPKIGIYADGAWSQRTERTLGSVCTKLDWTIQHLHYHGHRGIAWHSIASHRMPAPDLPSHCMKQSWPTRSRNRKGPIPHILVTASHKIHHGTFPQLARALLTALPTKPIYSPCKRHRSNNSNIRCLSGHTL